MAEIIIADCDQTVRELYRRILSAVGTEGVIVKHAKEAIPHLNDARLLVLDDCNGPFAGEAREIGYKRGIVFNGDVLRRPEHVNEAWQKPLQLGGAEVIDILSGIVLKYTSPTPRILYFCETEDPRTEWHLKEMGYTVVQAKDRAEATKNLPSVHAAVLAANSNTGKDCVAIYDTIRGQYNRTEMPVVAMLKGLVFVSAEGQEPIQSIRNPRELELLLRRLVPEHLKPEMWQPFS